MTTQHRPIQAALAAVLIGACGSSTPRTPVESLPPATPASTDPAPAVARPAPTPPALRLPALARPTSNQVELTLDPTLEDFSGVITIELEVLQKTDLLWLNAFEITVDQATLTVGGKPHAATPHYEKEDFLALVFAEVIEPGPATLRIAYRGKMHRDDGTGLYPVKENDAWYLYTQFESTDAREAFPCFDEPSYKVPWQVTVRTRKELIALSNTPIESEIDEPGGLKAVRFAATPPLPSYLVAVAVGPFDFVDAGKSRTGVPVRIVVPRGRGADAAYAAQNTLPILALLEDYFGTPYPFAKLDLIAVPVFNAGAMENPGLITYRMELLLSKPEELTLRRQQYFATVTAHELAHQWFGDLVTMAWWDDIWLNESFATWAEGKVIHQWKPEWQGDVYQVTSKSGVMKQDSMDTARMIRQPIETRGDIANAFDGITYQKGEAVIGMLELWIGEATFQKGVRAYMQKHAWGNASYDDFVAAISEAAGRDVSGPFDSFVKQSGVPLLAFELACDKGAQPKLTIAQSRYKPMGSKIDPARTWQVPVCVKYGAGKQVGGDCMLLTEASGELPLTGAKSCPDWVLPNAGGIGYYRMVLGGDLLARLIKQTKKLDLAERVGVLGDVDALVAAGTMSLGDALRLVDVFAKDQSRQVVEQSIGIVAGIDLIVPDELRPNYQRFVRKVYGKRAAQLGLAAKPGEDDETKQLRPRLVGLVADEGADPKLIAEATKLTWKWLDDRKGIDADMLGTVLGIAANHGDRKMWDRFHDEAKKATAREDRARLMGGLASFRDPELYKASLALLLTDEFEFRDMMPILGGRDPDLALARMAYQFIKEHYDVLVTKLPGQYAAYMPYWGISMCNDGARADLEAFFRERNAKVPGGARVLDQAIEQVELCNTQRKAQLPGVIEFLKKQ